MNVYEFNQAGYNSLPALTDEQIKEKIKDVHSFLQNHPSKYYMVLCRELNYYTVYTFADSYKFKELAAEIVGITMEMGELKEIEINDSSVEIWISNDNECHMYYLFDYAGGVIEV